MLNIWHRKTSAAMWGWRHPSMLSLQLPRKILYLCAFFPFLPFLHFLLFKAMRQGMDCARTMEPSLHARSLIPHIHGYDRTHPSVLSLHAESESLSALSGSPRARWGRELRPQLAMSIKPVNRKRAGGGDWVWVYRQNWSRVLLELLFERRAKGL